MSLDAETLTRIEVLRGVPTAELEWLAGACVEHPFTAGETLFTAGEPATALFFIVDGTLELSRRESGHEVASYQLDAGETAGRLPFSRMTTYPVSGVAQTDGRKALLAQARFGELAVHAPTVQERLVHRMLDRTRDVTRFDVSREKLEALGTMAAGLAHELNNPASAARRTADDLASTLQAFDEHSSAIVRRFLFVDPDAHDGDPFAPVYEAMTLTPPAEGALALSDLEDELGEWLDERGVADPWQAAPTLISGGFTATFLRDFATRLVPDQVNNFLGWVTKDVEMRLLAREMVESTRRIAELVTAMKSYSYMDQHVSRTEVDLHAGIDATLRVLDHKIKPKRLQVVRRFADDLPPVQAYGGELNQVWTNLIDNAIAAVAEAGTLEIHTRWDRHADTVVVDVIDDGTGIPDDVRPRIFEPFFTTRPVGEGTGLGLDITHRIVTRHHRGSIQVDSRPGHTRFRVRLPRN